MFLTTPVSGKFLFSNKQLENINLLLPGDKNLLTSCCLDDETTTPVTCTTTNSTNNQQLLTLWMGLLPKKRTWSIPRLQRLQQWTRAQMGWF
jgi:hypothetical protein